MRVLERSQKLLSKRLNQLKRGGNLQGIILKKASRGKSNKNKNHRSKQFEDKRVGGEKKNRLYNRKYFPYRMGSEPGQLRFFSEMNNVLDKKALKESRAGVAGGKPRMLVLKSNKERRRREKSYSRMASEGRIGLRTIKFNRKD